VRRCLAKGVLTGIDLRGRQVKRLREGKRILEVIAIEISGGFLVVTAYRRGEWP
jgi:hypothetical protein